VELVDDVPRGAGADVAHTVLLAREVEDDVVRPRAAADRLDLPLEHDDRDVVGVGVRLVPLTGLEYDDVRLELAEVPRRPLDEGLHPGPACRVESARTEAPAPCRAIPPAT
jgi:hypothetical protein